MSGAQPMVADRDGTAAVLSFCGEVYNFVGLRREPAARGHRFGTDSDTGVMPVSYLE